MSYSSSKDPLSRSSPSSQSVTGPYKSAPRHARAAAPEPESPVMIQNLPPHPATPLATDHLKGSRSDVAFGNYNSAVHGSNAVPLSAMDAEALNAYVLRSPSHYVQNYSHHTSLPEAIPQPASDKQIIRVLENMASLTMFHRKALVFAQEVECKSKKLLKHVRLTRRQIHQEREMTTRMHNYITFARMVPGTWSYDEIWGHPIVMRKNEEDEWEELSSDEWPDSEDDTQDTNDENVRPASVAAPPSAPVAITGTGRAPLRDLQPPRVGTPRPPVARDAQVDVASMGHKGELAEELKPNVRGKRQRSESPDASGHRQKRPRLERKSESMSDDNTAQFASIPADILGKLPRGAQRAIVSGEFDMEDYVDSTTVEDLLQDDRNTDDSLEDYEAIQDGHILPPELTGVRVAAKREQEHPDDPQPDGDIPFFGKGAHRRRSSQSVIFKKDPGFTFRP